MFWLFFRIDNGSLETEQNFHGKRVWGGKKEDDRDELGKCLYTYNLLIITDIIHCIIFIYNILYKLYVL